VVSVFNIIGTDIKPAFGKINGFLHFGGPFNGATPDCAHGSVYFKPGILSQGNVFFGHFPIIIQRKP